ncbi:hypothetical protein EYF80_033332 [Liparis tanakae]|uniref:Secreted protein n=1 Tax=Liparis tanakae TaxID=230148 RepID=A0A4Z2GUQ6_9TELE|nr:hypothetical protein EYF80_033332 [Liparis tanakae]
MRSSSLCGGFFLVLFRFQKVGLHLLHKYTEEREAGWGRRWRPYLTESERRKASQTSCVSSSIWTRMETSRPAGGWAGGRRPGSRVDTPKLSGAPSLCPAAVGLSAGSTMAATARGSGAAGASVHV